jgi:hypothetical protein
MTWPMAEQMSLTSRAQAWQAQLREVGSQGAIALARTRLLIGMVGRSGRSGGSAHQRGDVVGQNLGRHVSDKGLVRQTRGRFKVQPGLDPLKCLVDSSALVKQVTERRGRALFGIDVGGEQADLAVARNSAHPLQRGRLGEAIPSAHIVSAWRAQHHRAVQRGRATKGCGGTPDPAPASVAGHDGANATGTEQGHQSGRRALGVARPIGRHQYIRIPGRYAQPAPARGQDSLICAANQEIVKRVQRRQMQVLTHLGESPVRGLSNPVGAAAEAKKHSRIVCCYWLRIDRRVRINGGRLRLHMNALPACFMRIHLFKWFI